MSQQVRSLLHKAVDNPDVTLAALGCILAVPLTIYQHLVNHNPVYAPIGVIVFLACLAYILISRRSSASVRAQPEATPRMYLLLNIMFFVLLTYSILAFHLRPDLYTRPLGYFIALAAMAAVVAAEIIFLPSRKAAAPLALFKIMVIGVSLGWSQLLLYPSVAGVDPWYHQDFTAKILQAGHVPPDYLYSGLPGMHLVAGTTSLITGLEYKLATMLSVSLLMVTCNVLFMFLLGRFIHSPRAGLLAALLLGAGNFHIWWVYWTVPNGMAVVFIPIVVYLLFKLRRERPGAAIGLAAVLMAALMVTHAIGALMLGMALFFVWFGAAIRKGLRYRAAVGFRVFLVAAILFSGVTLIYSGLVSGQTRHIVWLGRAFMRDYPTGILPPGDVDPPPDVVAPPVDLPPLSEAVAQYRDYVVPLGEHLFNNLGVYLFYAVALIGAFALLSRHARNSYGFAFVIAGLLILATTFFVILPFRPWLAGRFNHFLQVLLAVPLGIALIWLAGRVAKASVRVCLVATTVFALAFLMILSPQANLDNRTFAPNTIIRQALTYSEVRAFHTASVIYGGEIGVDSYCARPLRLILAPDNEIYAIDEQLYSQDYDAFRDMLVLIRTEVLHHPVKFGGGVYRLQHEPDVTLAEQGFSRIYDNGSVGGLVH